MIKAVIIISIIILAMYYLVHRLKILNGYKKKYDDILIETAYKAKYINPGDCPKGYRIPSLNEFKLFYNENENDSTQKFILDDTKPENE